TFHGRDIEWTILDPVVSEINFGAAIERRLNHYTFESYDACIVVFSIKNRESFRNAVLCIERFRLNFPEKSHGHYCKPMLLVGTMKDWKYRAVAFYEALALAHQWN